MNKKQRRVILLGFVVILLMGLFPPWTATHHAQALYSGSQVENWSYESGAGYRLLVPPPRPYKDGHTGSKKTYRVDTSLLLCQWFLVSAVTGIIVMYLGDRPQSPTNKPAE